LVLVVLGLVLLARGTMLYVETESGGFIQNWTTPATTIPSKAYMWTWGVEGVQADQPDSWHFHVVFEANATGEVFLMWNLNQSVLFNRNSSKIDETFEVVLPRTSGSWRWDWLIKNPNSSGLTVDNFTVSHYSIRYPERMNGLMAIGAGLIMVVAAAGVLAYFRRRRISRTEPSSPQL
jgi:hypothetical protein